MTPTPDRVKSSTDVLVDQKIESSASVKQDLGCSKTNMKINEKNLAAYSVSATPVDREGYLLKKGEVNKNFQRRWFVLKGNLLFYFEKKGDKEPIGVVILEGCTIELAECEDQFSFKLVFHGGGGRSYVLAADSQESLEDWMKALARASYDYLKLMVAELQRQLDELNEAERVAKGGSDSTLGADPPKKPPRQRHNPFNKPQNSNEVALDPSSMMRLRANTISGGAPQPSSRMSLARSDSNASVSGGIFRKSFIQIHTEYGIPILRDKELYMKKKQLGSLGGRAEEKPNLEHKQQSSTPQPKEPPVTELISI